MPRKNLTRKKATRRVRKKVGVEPETQHGETPNTLDQFKQCVRIVSTRGMPKEL